MSVAVTDPRDFLVLVLCSASGAGKTTLKDRLLAEHPELGFSVSHTTRARRATEEDGREYRFVTKERFLGLAADGAFAEWAEVHGHHYGTSLAELERARETKRGVVFDIDVQGARQLRAALPEAVLVFVLPPSLTELERRLRGRRDEGDEAIARRLEDARGELAAYGLFDYVILNDDVDRASKELSAIVLAERARRWRRAPLAERLLATGAAR